MADIIPVVGIIFNFKTYFLLEDQLIYILYQHQKFQNSTNFKISKQGNICQNIKVKSFTY
jgi:hypothetical protein